MSYTGSALAHKCRNILAAGWEAHLNTIKADAKGSKGEIYTSRVHYMIQKATPYLIVPENDMHNIMPPRVAMTGDILRLKDSKVPIIADSLKKAILKEHEASSAASHGVSAILSSAGATCRSRSEGLLSLLNEESPYSIFKFDIGINAVMLSIDHHGFDVLAKVPERATLANVPHQYHWKEFRFTLKEPAKDAEDFCCTLVELEEEVLQRV
ncbi:uncharacterized protein C2845_PM02G01830 [Panicum miliaceum]|uniref:Uncharacterized protein n=1 Tax=Panicum miliaceum TaxID=4540 RepID=A0A3L6SAS3_PANMI|nr:uncharacterized protein C2845_PM02G01830 [Panicum miliaceum]